MNEDGCITINADKYNFIMGLVSEIGVYVHTENPTNEDRKDTLELYLNLYDTLNECDSDD